MKDIIEEIQKIDLTACDIEDFSSALTRLFTGLKIICPVLDVGTKLYRIRIVNERPKTIPEISFPPTHLIQRMGRLNRIGQSIGYLSTSRKNAYYEIRPKVSNYVALSRWRIISPLTLIHIGYTKKTFELLASKKVGDEYEWARKTVGWDDCKYEFLSTQFMQKIGHDEEFKYKLSIAIADKLIGAGPHDGLLFPSVAMWGNSDNVGLSPRAYKKIKLYSIEYNLITKIEADKLDVNFIDASVQWDGDVIKWKGGQLNWQIPAGCEYKYEVVDDEFICTDENGKEIDPS